MSAPLTEQQKLIHFLNRTSFGPRREDVEKIQRLGIRAYLDEQLHPERITDNIVEEKIAGLKTMPDIYPVKIVETMGRHGSLVQ